MKATNSDSCVLDAFSKVTGVPTQALIDSIGHDGRGKGFTVQEMISALVPLGYAVTVFDRNPMKCFPDGQVESVYCNVTAEARWDWSLLYGDGVVFGKKSGSRPHAMAWVDGKLYDVSNPSGTIFDADCNLDGWVPWKFALVTRIEG